MGEVWSVADDFRLDTQTRALLERWVRSSSSQQRAVRRSRIILALGEGLSVTAVSAREGIGRRTVAVWKARFLTEGAEFAAARLPRPGPAERTPGRCRGLDPGGDGHAAPGYQPLDVARPGQAPGRQPLHRAARVARRGPLGQESAGITRLPPSGSRLSAYRAEQGVGFHPAAPGSFLKSELVRYGPREVDGVVDLGRHRQPPVAVRQLVHVEVLGHHASCRCRARRSCARSRHAGCVVTTFRLPPRFCTPRPPGRTATPPRE